MAPLLHKLTSSHDTVQGCHSSESYKFPDFSLTFHWPLNSFHWPIINEKQSMFTFTLAFFAGHRYFSLHFQTRSSFHGKREKELKESIHNKNHWPQLLHVSGVECQIDCFACSAAYFSSFPKENAFWSLEENLWTINQKKEFPDFSLTLIFKILLVCYFCNVGWSGVFVGDM